MRKSRKRSRKMDILKVMVCVLLLVLAGFGITKFVQSQQIAEPVANVQGATASPDVATTGPSTTPEVEKKDPTLNKTSADIYVSNTFDLEVQDSEDAVTYSSSDEKVASVSEDGVVTGVGKGTATITAVVGSSSLTCDVNVKKSKLVALTFDDGPGRYTPVVLDALEKYDAKATFFVVGQSINKTTTEYMKRAVSLGCEIGNHSYTHPNFKKITIDQVKEEVEKTNNAIEKAIGTKPTLIRVPYGGSKPEVKAAIDMPQIIWSVDTNDWMKKNRNSDYLTKYVLEHASDGDIVLMHDIHKTSAYAVEGIVKGLQEKGFELVTVDELAAAKNKELSAHTIYGCF